MSTSTFPRAPSRPDPGALEQILRIQESLLLGDVGPADLPGRICQAAALVVGAAAVRLVERLAAGAVVERAVYEPAAFTAAPAAALGRAATLGRPVLEHAGTRHLLSVPLRIGDADGALDLLTAEGAAFGPEHIAWARYAAAVAAVALHHACDQDRMARANDAKAQALVAVSHDVRTPLNVLLGYTRLLIEETYGPCTEEQRHVLASVERHARELLSVVSGALDLVRLELERGAPRREEFAVADLVEDVCTGSLAHRVANGVQLAWHVDPGVPRMYSDPFRVRQILQNLVDNALRFTQHGTVSVTVSAHATGVRLTVADSGPGIAVDDVPHLFELFRSGAARAGTGCGLYLVKRFSESLGGSVGVESAPGAGARFTVDLPVAS